MYFSGSQTVTGFARRIAASRSKTGALVATIAITLLMALSTEQSHAHEQQERAFECEICMDFSFGDDLLPVDRPDIAAPAPVENYSFPRFFNSETRIIRLNSRGPPAIPTPSF